MKSAILLAVAVVIVSSLPVVLRHTEAAAQEGAPARAVSTQGNQPPAFIAQVRPGSSLISGSASRSTDVGPVNREAADKVNANFSKAKAPNAGDSGGLKTRKKKPAVTLAAK